ncbi:MAG: hypothetical protein ACE5QF_08290 [Thermoplasmata archaeon]
MVEVLKMNASKPEEDRIKILKARVEGFAGMTEDERRDAMANLLDALGMLSEQYRIKIVKTRTDILTQISKDERKKIMNTGRGIFSAWDEDRKEMEMRAIIAATEGYPLLKRMMVRKMFKRTLA